MQSNRHQAIARLRPVAWAEKITLQASMPVTAALPDLQDLGV